jgi:tRNA(Ile)-lysidine synthase
MRGADLSGLSGIKNTSSIVRPLLNFTVEEIKKTIADYNIEYREDQSNATNKYLRNSLRNEIIPLLKSKTNGFEKKMETTMNRLENIDIWHNSIAEKFKTKYKLTGNLPQAIQISDLLSMPDFIIEKIFKKFEITRANSSAFINFLSSSSGSTFKANQFRFFHNRGTVIIDYNKSESNPIIHEIKQLPAKINTNNSLIEFVVKDEMLPYSPTIQQIDFSKVKMPITLRPWQFGDKIQPLGMSGTKLISDILINKKIPNHQKNSIQILQDSNNNILLIIGLVISEQFKITATTSKILKIKRSEFS